MPNIDDLTILDLWMLHDALYEQRVALTKDDTVVWPLHWENANLRYRIGTAIDRHQGATR